MSAVKFKFTIQQYQTEAVESVVNVFNGQPFSNKYTYRRDVPEDPRQKDIEYAELYTGFANAKLEITPEQLRENIRSIQDSNNIDRTDITAPEGLGACSLDVEMETGTGKTYVYTKTMFELNKRYGWSKFIVVVPSIAVREGVRKSFEVTEAHFMESYGKKARVFVYSSGNLTEIDRYSQSDGLEVMIINIQAFNTSFNPEKNKEGRGGYDAARVIFSKRDDFGSRRPVDVIAANHPIIILDEPQKMGGGKTQAALRQFSPLFCLNYSATHKEHHDLVYVLDALKAYQEKLVKRIEVKGFEVKNLAGMNSYIFIGGIVLSPTKPPMARIEFEVRRKSGIKRETRILGVDDDLFALSGEMEQYKGYVISEVDPLRGSVTFTNTKEINAGDVTGDTSEETLRRVQIRETIRSHLEKERELYAQGIKVLSLFFIDEVAKYRKYDEDGQEINSEYGRIFEEEYEALKNEYSPIFDTPYGKYLCGIQAEDTHSGYFSIDKGHKVNSKLRRGSDESDDVSAYDLILKDKERLLSFDNPVRFIFSHSALREGWDNPNVFQICTLKHGGSSAIQKRQEVGRGLRLCVNQFGDRQDTAALGERVQEVNRLTVIASEGYSDFVAGLQEGINEGLYRHKGEEPEGKIPVDNAYKKTPNPLNANFYRKEFQELWQRINHKYRYTVEYSTDELIKKAVKAVSRYMQIAGLHYTITTGIQNIRNEDTFYFKEDKTKTTSALRETSGSVKYDLVGNIAENTAITRRTAGKILEGVIADKFKMFRVNPEEFMKQAVRLITEQKAAMIIEHITYDPTERTYDTGIFTAEFPESDLKRAYESSKNVQKYVLTDGYAKDGKNIEHRFAEDMDKAEEVCVYAKLPRGFTIPTPMGNYSPDWAIAFREGTVKHVFFIAETKGSMSSMNLRPIEYAKIECARRLFDSLHDNEISYGHVTSYEDLMNILKA